MKSGFAAIIGRPNVGKSTLLNSLLGSKITPVSPKPQTTRIKISGILNLPEAQIIFWDCPGIFQTKDSFNKKLVLIALSSLKDIDIVLWMIDSTNPYHKDDSFILSHFINLEKKFKRIITFLLINKIDKIKKDEIIDIINYYKDKFSFDEIIPISALKGINIPELKEAIIKYLPEGPKYFEDNQRTDTPEKLLLSEFIREKIFLYTHQEIPYCSAVIVNEIRKIEEKNMLYIQADILVNKNSLKKILVGNKGKMIKKIGTSARQDIEIFLKSQKEFNKNVPDKVYLDLFVKVREDWKESPYILQNIGLS